MAGGFLCIRNAAEDNNYAASRNRDVSHSNTGIATSLPLRRLRLSQHWYQDPVSRSTLDARGRGCTSRGIQRVHTEDAGSFQTQHSVRDTPGEASLSAARRARPRWVRHLRMGIPRMLISCQSHSSNADRHDTSSLRSQLVTDVPNWPNFRHCREAGTSVAPPKQAFLICCFVHSIVG